MPNYGFTVGILRLTRHMKPDDYLPFNIADLDEHGGLQGHIEQLLRILHGPEGHNDEKRSSWFKVKKIKSPRIGPKSRPLVAEIDGGTYGRRFGRYNVENQEELDPITGEQVLTSDGYLFFALENEASAGLVIAETQGVASHLTRVLMYLNKKLIELGLRLRLERDAVDAVAWNNLFNDDDTHIASVRLTKPNQSGDGTSLGGRGVRNAKVELSLESGSSLEKRIAKEAKKSIKQGHPTFVSLVTDGKFEDDDFQEASVTTINDGRKRSVQVTQELPRFVYNMGDKERPTWKQLLTAARSVALDTVSSLEISLPKGVWPK